MALASLGAGHRFVQARPVGHGEALEQDGAQRRICADRAARISRRQAQQTPGLLVGTLDAAGRIQQQRRQRQALEQHRIRAMQGHVGFSVLA